MGASERYTFINVIKEGKSKVIRVLNLRHEDIRGNEYIDPRFLDLGTSWR
jgi:hypothetical protein